MPRGDESSEMPTMPPTFEFDYLTSPTKELMSSPVIQKRCVEKAVSEKKLLKKNQTHIFKTIYNHL